MKVLACSDFQLGSGAEYGTPAQPRLRDQEEALAYLARAAAGCDLALFLGDACQTRRPSIDELLAFGRWLAALPCEALLLPGNHDVRGPGLPSVLDLFTGLSVMRPRIETRQLPGEPPVVFGMLPWAHPGSLRAAAGPQDPQEHAEALLAIAADMRAEAELEAPGAHAVLCTHYALSGMSIPGGLVDDLLVGEPVLDAEALGLQGWTWIFAGHIHAPAVRVVGKGAAAVSVGSPYVCDFGEADSPHGAWLLDTETDELEHLPVPGRPFVTIDNVDLWDDPPDVAGAVVRARIPLTEEGAASFDAAAYRKLLYDAGAHKVYSVSLDVQRPARARAEGLAEDTEPLEALEAWASLCLPEAPADAERLRGLTRRYLEEAT